MNKILIVDDNASFRGRLKAFLASDPGVQVIGEAEDGFEAMIKTNTLKPDVVLMDVKMMDGMNGLNTTQRLKAAFPEIQVIILSRYDLEAYRETAQAMGASAYIVKKTLVEELLPAIRWVMANRIRRSPGEGQLPNSTNEERKNE